MDINELIDNFEFLDDWEDKYKYIIDLGNDLENLDDKYKNDTYIVKGCQSQVWLVPQVKNENNQSILSFVADSDAIIVRGLIAIIKIIYNNKTLEDIKQIDIEHIFGRIGLFEHLSPSRRNGLISMVDKIKSYSR